MEILIELMGKPLILLWMGQRNLSNLHHHLFAGGYDSLGCLSERRTGHKMITRFWSKSPGQHASQGTITEEVCQSKPKEGQSFTQMLEAGVSLRQHMYLTEPHFHKGAS